MILKLSLCSRNKTIIVKHIKILLVDNDEDNLRAISEFLLLEGYSIITCKNSLEAVELAVIEKPNLILFELIMQDMDGIDLCIELSKQKRLENTMFVFLTSRDKDFEQIAAFNAGADDYIVKPVKPRVLNKRITALLRRTKESKSTQDFPKVRNLRINEEYYLAYVDEKKTELCKKEFEILALLFSAPGKIFSRKEIYEKIWLTKKESTSRTLDVLMHNVRNKIGEDYIKTINKVGYYLDTTVEEKEQIK